MRKTERVGNSVMFAPVKNVLVFLVSATGMLFGGAILYSMTRSEFGLYAGVVIGFALGYVIAQMIAEKSFHVWRKMKYMAHFGGATLVTFVAIWLFTQFGMGFWTNFVPNENDVSGVFISHMTGGDMSHLNFKEDPQIIAMTIEAHRQILQEYRQNTQRNILPLLSWRNYDPNIRFSSVPITYRMHNGRYIRRHYTVTGEFFAQSILNDLFMAEQVIFHHYTSLEMPALIHSIRLEYRPARENLPFDLDVGGWVHEPTTLMMITDSEQVQALAEAIRQDLIARAVLNMQTRLEPLPTGNEQATTWRQEASLSATMITQTALRFDHVWLHGEFENSARLLREWGYLE